MHAGKDVHARSTRRKDGSSSARYWTDKPTIHRSMDQERTANIDRVNRANHGAISLHLHLFGPFFPSFFSPFPFSLSVSQPVFHFTHTSLRAKGGETMGRYATRFHDERRRCLFLNQHDSPRESIFECMLNSKGRRLSFSLMFFFLCL